MDDDAGWLGAGWNAGVVAGISGNGIAYEEQILQPLLTRFNRNFPSRQRRHDGRFTKETRLLLVVVLVLLLLLLLLLLAMSLEQLMAIVAAGAEDL
jgi:hypothetical protein